MQRFYALIELSMLAPSLRAADTDVQTLIEQLKAGEPPVEDAGLFRVDRMEG